MKPTPRVFLSGFADESTTNKTVVEQFAVFAALGLQYYSIRFVNLGDGIKNVMKLTKSDIQRIRQFQDEYGLNVSSLGSPIGKIKLEDVDDGTSNTYVPITKYLDEVRLACDLAHALETKLIRGFSFYPPKGADPHDYIGKSVEWLGKIAEVCHRSDLTFGLEVETNLVGHEGIILSEIYRQVNHPAMMLIFDGGNIVMQGYSSQDIFEQYEAMKPGLGWIHVKDFSNPRRNDKGSHVEEDKMKNFVPPDQGESGHERIFRDLVSILPSLEEKLKSRGIPGVFLDLEPHLKGGGQYGGYSGSDGMGVALRALCRTLDYVGISYHLRDFDDIRAARGF
ncbi:MAG: sugar phosphate isomerase/epimerase [Planctomycetaceae bacterium]|jgi:sugar phosphate isomerase/epimerase|nr:sugar phosphate isomerase/epimerase [Planctomycetaceae bacterium]